jgi:dihydroorotase
MITIKNVKLLDDQIKDVQIKGEEKLIDAKGELTLLPALIDPHVHFRTPGHEFKENWISGAKAAIWGGYTTVFDMPNTNPPCTTKKALKEKIELVNKQLQEVDIPLRVKFYLGADENHLEEIIHCRDEIIGIKIYMGSTTGGLVMHKKSALEKVFQIAAQEDIIVTVHAEDEAIIQKNQKLYSQIKEPSVHSKIRERASAIKATTEAIELAERFGTELMIAHVTTKEELDLIRQAKKKGLLVYGEATPHHLFLTEQDYPALGTKAQMNPPLRTKEDQQALWEALRDGTIDVIGSDHAPHTLQEKSLPYGQAPSGVPGIETTLPLLMTASLGGLLSVEKVVALTRLNPERIFRLTPNSDVILVDMKTERVVDESRLKTKCGWSPFAKKNLRGWPVYTICQGRCYAVGV